MNRQSHSRSRDATTPAQPGAAPDRLRFARASLHFGLSAGKLDRYVAIDYAHYGFTLTAMQIGDTANQQPGIQDYLPLGKYYGAQASSLPGDGAKAGWKPALHKVIALPGIVSRQEETEGNALQIASDAPQIANSGPQIVGSACQIASNAL